MGWRLRIEHITNVTLRGPGSDLVQRGADDPADAADPDHARVPGDGGPGVPVWTYNDYWGTFVSVFDLPEPHDDLVIRATATVETEPFGGIPATGGTPLLGGARREVGGWQAP